MRAPALLLIAFATHAASLSAAALDALPKVSAGQLVRHADFPSEFVPARHIDVWLPPGYSDKVRHAVLYMHDGQMLFDAATTWNRQEWRVDEVAAELIAGGTVRPFIVVGVHNAGVDRPSEYLPQKVHAGLSDGLRARLEASRQQGDPPHPQPVDSDDYLRFLTEELKPFVDRHYAVATGPADTLVMGSSMGGLISLYALLEKPEVFGAAACVSTHWPLGFVLDEPAYPQAMVDYLDAHLPEPARGLRLYFDYGTGTLDAHYPPSQARADAVMRKRGYASPQWVTREFPGAEHSEQAWAERLAIPLTFLLGHAAPSGEDTGR